MNPIVDTSSPVLFFEHETPNSHVWKCLLQLYKIVFTLCRMTY